MCKEELQIITGVKKIPAQSKRGFWPAGNDLHLDVSGSCVDIHFIKIHETLLVRFVHLTPCYISIF